MFFQHNINDKHINLQNHNIYDFKFKKFEKHYF